MNLSTRANRLDAYFKKREQELIAYLKQTHALPAKKSFAFAAFLLENFIKLGVAPPLPSGYKNIIELRDKSHNKFAAYVKALPGKIKDLPVGEDAKRIISVRLFDQWLAISGDKV
ncbi:MAG: hypothetical protein HYR56_16955 [Acidobacteria bacterium]|nr:hypothetical protein [Acidobacteriota bacterium]MBI3428011.1 hypothetical protein [Acidobacteriota bacterium]